MTGTAETFELSHEQAEFYEARFVPALFAEWAPLLVDAAGVQAGDRVLDVACGTGIVTRTAAARVGSGGTVVGLDRAQAMLDVAARVLPGAQFRKGEAEHLPFGDASFDTVLCQAGLMFVSDPGRALSEMARVVTADGSVGVQVWGRLESSPGYLPFVETAARHAGPDVIGLLSTYFVHGDLAQLTELLRTAGLELTSTTTRLGAMRYGSIDEFVTIEVESTPLVDRIDEPTYHRIRTDCHTALHPFLTDSGLALPIEGHIVVARKASA